MNAEQFDKLRKELADLSESIAAAKSPDYTQGNVDVLANFKKAAEEAGITPLQSWLVHFHKHYSAILRAAKNTSATPSEPVICRFADLRNYLDLGLALFADTTDLLKEKVIEG